MQDVCKSGGFTRIDRCTLSTHACMRAVLFLIAAAFASSELLIHQFATRLQHVVEMLG